jgi:hypothetical protein
MWTDGDQFTSARVSQKTFRYYYLQQQPLMTRMKQKDTRLHQYLQSLPGRHGLAPIT